jgi:hypothetical protein
MSSMSGLAPPQERAGGAGVGLLRAVANGLTQPRPSSRIVAKGPGLRRDPWLYMRKQIYRTPTRRPVRDTATILPYLSLDQRRALALVAGAGMNGVTETMMLARGFTLAMLGVLVRKRLVIAQLKPVRVGGKMIEVGRFRITDTGRQALQGESSRSLPAEDRLRMWPVSRRVLREECDAWRCSPCCNP